MMRALGFGIVAAAVVAGPKLFGLVEDGSMSGATALLRGGLVAAACAVGFTLVAMIGSAYTKPVEPEEPEDAAEGSPASSQSS